MLVWRIGSAYPARKGRRMSVTKLQDGELIALPRSVVRAERAAPDFSSADLSNVIPFSRVPSVRQAREIAPPREAEQKATEQPQDVPVAAEEKAPEAKPEQTEAPPETKLAGAPQEQEEKPRETSSDPEVALVPPPEQKPPHPKAATKVVHNA